jgi:lipoprotein-anchoring transpeptidase ErfK/SrfK
MMMITGLYSEILNKNTFIVKNRQISINDNFVVICTREKGSDGRFYFVDEDKTVVYSGIIASGSKNYKTPEGIYKIQRKLKNHMSTKYPEPSGINNMDYSLYFNGPIAMHAGNENAYSHGCVHLKRSDAKMLFKLLPIGTTVVVTKGYYHLHLSKNEKMYLFR